MESAADTPYVLSFADPRATDSASLRGAKGLSLARMHQTGMPVPPGFTITTALARYFMDHDSRIPPVVIESIRQALTELERETGRRFGDPQRPLLVSARSGAVASLPGMMDTILNIGLTDATYPGVVAYGGERFAADCRDRLQAMCRDTVGTAPPDDPWEQLLVAIEAVLRSWNNPHAKIMRELSGIDHTVGTAVTIQAMVYGNRGSDSGTGVARSCDVNTGDRYLCGEYLPDAQGEDVVSGTRTPLPLSALRDTASAIYGQLKGYVSVLEDGLGAPVEIEFTIEEGTLYLLQYRKAVLSPTAAAVCAVRLVEQGSIAPHDAVSRLTESQIEHLLRANRFDPDMLESAKLNHLLGSGLTASNGVAVGRVALSSAQAIEMAREGSPVILVRSFTDPADLPGMLAACGIVTEVGGFTSHGAVVANSQRKPAIVGTGELKRPLEEGEWISIDATGTEGFVFAGQLPCAPLQHENEVRTFLEWARESYRKSLVNRGIDPAWLGRKIRLNSSFADFYLTWAMEREAMGTELEGPAVNLRHRVHAELASVMTCYLTAAIIREFNDSETRGSAYVCAREDLDWIESRCSAFAGTYRLVETIETISRLDMSDQAGFFQHAAAIFRKGHWEIAFCGEPWAIIADIVAAYLEGVIPDDTTFVDQTFNLQHHGGRLFDKHPLVKNEFSNEVVLRGQLNENLTASSIEDLYETACFSEGGGFQFAPSEEVLNIWRQGVKMGLWKERDKNDKDARVCTMAREKGHESHRGTPVNIGPFTVYAAGMHDIGKHDLDKFRTETNSVLVLLSDDRIEWQCNPTDYTILAKPLSDLGGVSTDWREFILRLFDMLVAGKRLLISCSKGHGRTGCCIASLIALIESGDRTPDPIAAVRQRYCGEAVETRGQAEAIFAIRNEPVPTRYWPQFPGRKGKAVSSPETPGIEFAP